MLNKSLSRNVILTPGPATTTDTVKMAQIVPDICPREPEFGLLMRQVTEQLTAMVSSTAEYAAVLFGGSGTAAVEAAVSSVVGEGTLLIVNNGAYGQRICEIADIYQIKHVVFPSPSDKPLDLEALEAELSRPGCKITHLAIVHHETTTGLLNPVPEIGELCQLHHIQLVVDAISSFAAVPIDMKSMNISYLISSSNKNIQGMPGISFVIAPHHLLNSLKEHPKRSLYLDLYEQYRFFQQTSQMRFTPPVQTLYALHQALDELIQEGVAARYARYCRSWDRLQEGLHALGLRTLVSEEVNAKLLISVIEPLHDHYHFQELHDHLYQKGVTIYPGKLSQQRTFRIGVIGAVNADDIDHCLGYIEEYLTMIGFLPERGECDG
ncbi:2-aminoethylphosphonate--pyruvate transaminase [Paenibacillus sp. JX-17]|uniref:2-aminoethylphosphonate--pyruvate transaminase n=1 Tax=Paenibacillus lacisoli TaxID=3064525 RepID=A0ABT9C8N0_9BACL|nr:2-aminoethylphosphonate--pyruvate transaminase [Paenibacillus sp. JX-17]MDO7905616.1 2-aminoethylphosphonate--pyruvate transaminase [Paenibacillus sp. JX-17]